MSGTVSGTRVLSVCGDGIFLYKSFASIPSSSLLFSSRCLCFLNWIFCVCYKASSGAAFLDTHFFGSFLGIYF